MASRIRRRELLAAFGGAATWPLAAGAQQSARPMIGLLNAVAFEGAFAPYVEEIRLGLEETGFIEGHNVAIEYRTADGRPERLPQLAADLVRRQVAVVVAIGGTRTAFAARDATSTIPIVFADVGDAIETGLVKCPNRPETNLTGVSFTMSELARKRLELLCELAPRARLIGFLDNILNPADAVRRELVANAQSINRQIVIFFAGTEPQIDQAFAGIAQQHVAGLLVSADAYLHTRQGQIIARAQSNAIPMVVPWGRDALMRGALMSYATLPQETFRPAGIYAGRILKGARPADLPVLLPTRCELAINLKLAKTLGLTVPHTLLVAADAVIE